MGEDIHEKRRLNGTSDPNPLAQKFESPEAAATYYRGIEGYGYQKASWQHYKAKAIARKRIRGRWYHGAA